MPAFAYSIRFGMLRNQTVTVSGREAGLRLERFLRERFPAVPSRSVRFALAAGAVRVAGAIAQKGRALREGETVSVAALAECQDWLPVPGELPGAAVAYENGHVAVLCKPHDCHTEPQRPNETGTLAGHLLRQYPDVGEISPVPGLTLLTRLDYATSGAVPAALTGSAFAFLRHEREMGNLRKTYLCLVEGEIRSTSTIAFAIEAAGGERVRVCVERDDPDPSRWTVLEPVRVAARRTLARATIARGKRHQIRAHLAAAGHPIVGDRKYSAVPPEGPGRDRLMLHAEEVAFRHPVTGKPLTVRCPAPPEFYVN
jgi:23S rRNA pseudouridine1911/1915/1917 synthase